MEYLPLISIGVNVGKMVYDYKRSKSNQVGSNMMAGFYDGAVPIGQGGVSFNQYQPFNPNGMHPYGYGGFNTGAFPYGASGMPLNNFNPYQNKPSWREKIGL